MDQASAHEHRKIEARRWFEALQQELLDAMEALERDCPGPYAGEATEPGRFEIKPWTRTDHTGEPGGGGRMAMLSGRVFEKMGVQGGLRLGVLGGGCSGLSYQFKFDTQPRPKDKVFDFDGVHIFVDPKSILYLHGLTLDYKESLMQSGFVFENPNAKKSCGCGTSFTT